MQGCEYDSYFRAQGSAWSSAGFQYWTLNYISLRAHRLITSTRTRIPNVHSIRRNVRVRDKKWRGWKKLREATNVATMLPDRLKLCSHD
eukprot:scaffold381201_cov22-Prasinocladus_malaysianus.AAC.2